MCVILAFALILVAMVTNYSDFFSIFGRFDRKFCLFSSFGYCYNYVNPMNYHGPSVIKQYISSSPLLGLLVALVTIFISKGIQ